MAQTWTPISMTPLNGMLDSRSHPAEMVPGSYRYKLNFSINRTGSLCTRNGHAALDFGALSGVSVPNWDWHKRNGNRDAPDFLFESTAPNGIRRLYAGTPTRLDILDEGTSQWVNLTTGWGAARWRAAALENLIIFTNNMNGGVRWHTVGSADFHSSSATAIPSTRAKFAITFADVVLLMNVDEGGQPITSRVRWSDYKVGNDFEIRTNSVAGFKDLDYGDAILNAVEMLGALYIFTERAIWRMTVQITQDSIFSFQKVFSEPKSKSACLAYPNSLVTTGRELYWLGRDSAWVYNPYIVAPEVPDWLLKGTGAFFSETNPDRFERRCCDAIIGEFNPKTREVWFSYPQGFDAATAVCLNNRCLVLNTEFHTIDLVDHGYSALVNFQRTPGAGEACNAEQIFIGASTADFSLKNLSANVFYREMVNLVGGDRTKDIPDSLFALTKLGYFCRLVFTAPFGYPDREKIVRELLLEAEIAPNSLTAQNRLNLRVGNSYALQDSMSENAFCSTQWHEQDPMLLKCVDDISMSKMLAEGERPSDPYAFTIYETGHYLYIDLRVSASDGVSAPMFHDAKFSSFTFSVQVI